VRDQRDQADALGEALSRFGANTPITLFKSAKEYQELIVGAFERHAQEHWQEPTNIAAE
jgi:hypothetical protein